MKDGDILHTPYTGSSTVKIFKSLLEKSRHRFNHFTGIPALTAAGFAPSSTEESELSMEKVVIIGT
jgi:hypothetical protein